MIMSYTNQSDKRHLILIGYRGVGKTTIGKLLHEMLNLPFYDSDDEIVKRSGLTIPQLFDLYGEDYFRLLEETVIHDLCNMKEKIILSTGGGAVLSEKNRTELSINGTIFYLYCDEEVIFQRINEDANRPALTDKNLKEEIHFVLEQRLPLYSSIKDFEIDSSATTPEEITQLIFKSYL